MKQGWRGEKRKKERGRDGGVNWGFRKKADLPTAHQYTATPKKKEFKIA